MHTATASLEMSGLNTFVTLLGNLLWGKEISEQVRTEFLKLKVVAACFRSLGKALKVPCDHENRSRIVIFLKYIVLSILLGIKVKKNNNKVFKEP